jgi:Fur family transcriptional regulator, ferric uptake regulator
MKSNDIKKMFHKEGLRYTSQRNLVLDILGAHHTPLTAEDIYIKYHQLDESISLSTIYRILELFLSKDLIVKSHLTDENKACYALKHGHIHYLVCMNCKKVLEIEDCPVHHYEDDIKKMTDFRITGHKLELYGLCPKCQ